MIDSTDTAENNDYDVVEIHATATFQESELSLLGNYEVSALEQIFKKQGTSSGQYCEHRL